MFVIAISKPCKLLCCLSCLGQAAGSTMESKTSSIEDTDQSPNHESSVTNHLQWPSQYQVSNHRDQVKIAHIIDHRPPNTPSSSYYRISFHRQGRFSQTTHPPRPKRAASFQATSSINSPSIGTLSATRGARVELNKDATALATSGGEATRAQQQR